MEGKLLKTRTNRLLVNPVNGKYKMKPDKNYFRLKFVGEGTGEITIYNHDYLQYSLNGGPWESYTVNHKYTVSKGDVLYFRALYDQYGIYGYKNDQYTTFLDDSYFIRDNNSIDYEVSGNIASLFWVDFEGKTSLPTSMSKIPPREKGLRALFYNCKHFVYAYDLTIPFKFKTDISKVCQSMFYGCTNLTHAPKELPSTTLGDSAYYKMFYGCTKLTHVPKELPAKTVPSNCYSYMFYGCTSLITAPLLPATKLGTKSYTQMFYNCTKLKNVQINLPATVLPNECYKQMFYNCKSLLRGPSLYYVEEINFASCEAMFQNCSKLKYLGSPGHEFIQRIGTNSVIFKSSFACDSMFYGCSSLERAPILSATNLTVESQNYTYSYMFYGCSKLNYIHTRYLGSTFSNTIHSNWVYNVPSTGTFVKSTNATWTNSYGSSAIPSGWTVVTQADNV